MSASDIWRPVRKPSKSGLDRICSKLQAEVASLREAVKALQTANRRKSATVPVNEDIERQTAKQKRIAEREAARSAHAEFLAKQAAAKPAKDKARAEWGAKERARLRESSRLSTQKWRTEHPEKAREATRMWRAANPEKNKASWTRGNEKQKAERAAKRPAEQIGARPDLSPGGSPL
jgi:hypothetical protein